LGDLETLKFIQERLNCGNIFINHKSATAKLEISSLKDLISKLIPLFENFPLNEVKYLDYLSFQQAIAIYLDKGLAKSEKHELIISLKESMNSKRVSFQMPSSHIINITPYWLLGLIEGEASFSVSKPGDILKETFYLSLTAVQAALMNAIKDFLLTYLIENSNMLLPSDYLINVRKVIGVYYGKERGDGNAKGQVELTISQPKFLVEKLIPLLSNLSFVTKKYKDFLD
jgi:hypothetical protein